MPVIGQRPEITLDDIVFATDFSPASKRAAAYAVAIARRYSSRLHVVSVVDLNIPMPSGEVTSVLPIQERANANRAQLERFVGTLSNVRCVMHIVESFSVPQAILSVAEDCDGSLIVMGTTSKGQLKKLLLGSVAEEVIRASRIPVLTVGPHVAPMDDAVVPFQRIVFANDLSTQATRALPVALAFAEDGGARLYVCRVVKTTESPVPTAEDGHLEKSLQRTLPAAAIDWCDAECVIEHGDPTTALLSLAERTAADLIVVGSRRSTFRLEYFEKGVTPGVIAQAKCPVLSLCA